ncbi:4842_t:CDS:2, partial [Racocetra persica]
VMIHNQKVIEYGQEYNNDQLNNTLEDMPGAIQLPIDQTHLPYSKPAKMVIVQRINNGNNYKVRVCIRKPGEINIITLVYDFYDMYNNKKYSCMVDTGALETILPYYVRRMLGELGGVSIGDDNNWTKWVKAKILLWEKKNLAIKWNMLLSEMMLPTN